MLSQPTCKSNEDRENLVNSLRNAVEQAKKKDPWGLGNQILYDLCKKYSEHKDEGHIFAKIWLIGRAYAAAIERRRQNQENKEDNHEYYKRAIEEINNSEIDKWILDLSRIKGPNESCFTKIIETHRKVLKLFHDISGSNKRSLASKYLHFHLPDRFYIYDSRAESAMKKFTPLLEEKSRPSIKDSDPRYSKFVGRCLNLQAFIEKNIENAPLTPRQIDRILLYGQI